MSSRIAGRSPAAAPRLPEAARAVMAVALITVALVAAYSNSFRVPLLQDDDLAIVDNPSIRHGTDLGAVISSPSSTTTARRPFLNLTFAVNYALGGQKVWGYHAVNLLVHVMSAIAMFGLLRRTLRAPGIAGRYGDAASWVAGAVAALWALDPLQTECVTYISQRAESMMGLFFLLTLYFFARSNGTSRSTMWKVLSIAACFLGTSTKEVMISAPILVLLYDRAFFSQTVAAALWNKKAYYCGLVLCWVWLAFLLAHFGLMDSGAGFDPGISSWDYACTESKVIVDYLRLALWPRPLVFDYGQQVMVHGLEAVWPFALIVVAAAAGAILLWRKSAPLGFLATSFFVLLAPTSSFIPVPLQPMAENRLYLSLAAIVSLFVVAVFRWMGPRSLAVFAIIALLLAAGTWARNEAYQSAETLWRDTVSKRPDNVRAWSNLGFVLTKDPGRINEVAAQYAEAVRLKPDYYEARRNLGNALFALGRNAEAIEQYEEALRIKPDYSEAHADLGNVLRSLGRLPEATEHYAEAIRLNPGNGGAHNGMGCVLAASPGRMGDAVTEFKEAIRLEPGNVEAICNLGNACRIAGRIPEAVSNYEEALRIDPELAEPHNNLGAIWIRTPGRMGDAILQFQEAVRIRPDFFDAHYNLANALVSAGRIGDAVSQFEEALRLRPEDARIHFYIAGALARIPGREDEAAAHLREAARLQPENEDIRQALKNITSTMR